MNRQTLHDKYGDSKGVTSNELECYASRYQRLAKDRAAFKRITKQLRAKGYTLETLANATGVNRSTVLRWERDDH